MQWPNLHKKLFLTGFKILIKNIVNNSSLILQLKLVFFASNSNKELFLFLSGQKKVKRKVCDIYQKQIKARKKKLLSGNLITNIDLPLWIVLRLNLCHQNKDFKENIDFYG